MSFLEAWKYVKNWKNAVQNGLEIFSCDEKLKKHLKRFPLYNITS